MSRIHCLLTLLAAASLASCTTGLAMKGMNGAATCPISASKQAHTNFGVLSQLNPGQSANLLAGLKAERRIQLTFARNEVVTADLYRTGHPRCRGLPTEEEFTPVLVSPEGIILGIGTAAFESYSKHSQRSAEITPDGPSEPTTLSGFMKSLPF